MHKKVVFFDFDGTIAETIYAGVSIYNNIAREYGFREITEDMVPSLREKSPRTVVKELEISRLKIPIVARRLKKELKEVISTIKPISGISDVILFLKQKGCKVGIITSNSKSNVNIFLKKNKLNVFDFINANSGIFYKAAAIKKTISNYELEDYEKIFIGDEIRDILAAKKNKVTVVSVTWGVNSRLGLENNNADFVVDTTEELKGILSDFCDMN